MCSEFYFAKSTLTNILAKPIIPDVSCLLIILRLILRRYWHFLFLLNILQISRVFLLNLGFRWLFAHLSD